MALFNEAFAPWVKEQIDVRQKTLGFTPFQQNDANTDKRLQQQVVRSPFLRLASAVDIMDRGENSVLQKLIKAGFNESDLVENTLAKKCILQAGVLDSTEGGGKKGLQYGLQNGNRFSGAYGWGVDMRGSNMDNRGFVPMPGITRAKSTAHNHGALNTTTVNIRCYSKEQFALIDALYMRPGYTVLLEFGWSQYIDNDGNTRKIDEFYSNPLSKVLNGQTNQFEIAREIIKEREYYNGNYDAVFGKVNNFNWTLNPDGSYDIVIEITGMGDVIESLKINVSTPVETSAAAVVKSDGLEDGRVDSLREFYESVRNAFRRMGEAISRNSLTRRLEDVEDAVRETIVPSYFKTKLHQELSLIESSLGFSGSDGDRPNNLSYILYGFKDEYGEIDKLNILNGLYSIKHPFQNNEGGASDPNYYMKFGALMAFLQSHLIPHEGKNKIPLFTFDMDFVEQTFQEERGGAFKVGRRGSTIISDGLKNDENYMLTFPGHISTDPTTCLIPITNFNVIDVSFPKPVWGLGLDNTNFSVDDNYYLGRLANIMVNTQYIRQVINSLPEDEDNKISFLEFIQTLVRGITSSLGGVNQIDVKLNQEGNKIQFIENIPQNLVPKKTNYSMFNVFGVQQDRLGGSFVRDIKLNATLGPNFATMISLGSQVDANQSSSNSVSLSNYSLGLKDRVIPTKILTPTLTEDVVNNNNDIRAKSIRELREQLNLGLSLYSEIYDNKAIWVGEALSTIKTFKFNMTTAFHNVVGILNTDGPYKQINSSFFLPFNLNLTMDGLSGMRLYEKFKITDHVLPPGYTTEDVDIQILGISHTISPEGWTTKLDTQSTQHFKYEKNSIKLHPAVLQNVTQATIDSTPDTPPANTDPILLPPTRVLPSEKKDAIKAIKLAYDRVNLRDQETSNQPMCARWTYNYAIEYINALKGFGKEDKQSRAGGNANQQAYWANLTKLGYRPRYFRSRSKQSVINAINSPNVPWKEGDIVVYFSNDPSALSAYEYGHTQIYTGDLSTSGWTSNKKENYKTSFVYKSRKSDNWTLVVFKAPTI